MGTLLAHLAVRRLTSQTEDLATEALGYLLSESPAARAAVKRHVARCGGVLPDGLLYTTQSVGEHEERPDVVGRSRDGVDQLLIEAKFWARLTEHQPITYLKRLPPGGILLFVVPEAKLPSAWTDLRERCMRADVVLTALDVPGNGMNAAALADGKILALTSWRRLLEDIHHAIRDDDQPQLAQDVVQLQGLCERMDTAAFLPIRGDELSADPYRRLLQFGDLPADALGMLVDRKSAARGNLRIGSGFGYRGNYFLLRGQVVFLSLDVGHWLKHGVSPLWLSVFGASSMEPRNRTAVLDALESLRRSTAPRLFAADGGVPIVPIRLPVGVERDRVLDAIVKQVEEVGDLIAHLNEPLDTERPVALGAAS